MTETSARVAQADSLNRAEFLSALEKHIVDLACVQLDHLASPRVLAVNAPWGSGKSWIANSLCDRLRGADSLHPVAFIDAFRYDHHDDAFAVIAASVMNALQPNAAQKKKYVKAAGAVLKVAVPVLLKAGANILLKTVGLDSEDMTEALEDAKDSVIDGASDASEKAVEKLLDSYANTELVQDEFIKTLSSLTERLPKPFVVIVDELDRCRPTFALEMLERIKHLFAADNVVFVLFWNADSICESVRHSYGRGTDAELYLSKFVAYSISIPQRLSSGNEPQSRYAQFIRGDVTRAFGHDSFLHKDHFVNSLAEFAHYFDASLRDLQKVVRLRKRISKETRLSEMDLAYVALLKVRRENDFLRLLAKDSSLFLEESQRFAVAHAASTKLYANEMFLVLSYLSDSRSFDTAFLNCLAKPLTELQTKVQIVIHCGPSEKRHEWLFEAANRLNDVLISPTS